MNRRKEFTDVNMNRESLIAKKIRKKEVMGSAVTQRHRSFTYVLCRKLRKNTQPLDRPKLS